MKKYFAPALLFCSLCLLPFSASADGEAAPPAAPAEKSFGQSISDGYHSLKDSVSRMMGGYSGDEADDSRTYMEHYRDDLNEYHDALRKARAEYRRARLNDQKAYLEHHDALPMQEDLDSDSGPLP
jgi:hypothetical protein